LPRYAIKQINGKRWSTKNKPLCDTPILAHLEGKYFVGVLGQWYPRFAIFDIDEQPIERVNEIREFLNLNDNNSMLFDSESKDSYHLIIKPHLNNNPPTIKRLQSALKIFAIKNNIEIYPQANRVIRLPFGQYQYPTDIEYFHLESWQDKLYWFNKLDEYDLREIEGQQLGLDLHTISVGSMPNIMQEAKELLEYGLQIPSSRHDSQFKILYYLWRNNVPQDQAEAITWRWIQNKHNGFSKEIIRHPGQVRKEISRQAAHIYSKYELSHVFPDTTHNFHHGYITEPDILEIIEICGASVPRMKFLFNIVKYSYPRRFRSFIGVHRDKLIKWSSEKTYLKYLNEFERKGILTRGKAYSTGLFSKDLKLDWKYSDSSEAILYEGRSIETFNETAKLIYKPEELREILILAGGDKGNVSRYIKYLYYDFQKL